MVSLNSSKWLLQRYHRLNENQIEERTGGMGTPTTKTASHDAALLILRIASSVVFLYHGSAILFGAFGGPGPREFAVNHRFPIVVGYLVGLAQVV